MKFLKTSARERAKLSLILLDWSVRESFHLLHYLSLQDTPREDFEVLILEYYARESPAIHPFADMVDSWVLLEMPESCYYHKHLMYNAGIVLAKGEICVVCDSDAMVKPGFIRALVDAFARDPQIVLHLDQFRNNRRDLYPFSYPSFEEVLGAGCINNRGGKTAGILDTVDPIHTRNYGACMAARRDALIEIGGADEHVDFLGHICGPYDMTFRLVASGRREVWHQSEFLYHTWHPGQAGADNYLGPHDGRHVSSTSLAGLASGRVPPLVENAAIRELRLRPGTDAQALQRLLFREEDRADWQREDIERGRISRRFDERDLHVDDYHGFRVYKDADGYYAHLPLDLHAGRGAPERYRLYAEGRSLEELKSAIDRIVPRGVRFGMNLGRTLVFAWQAARYLAAKVVRVLRRVISAAAAFPKTFRPRMSQFLTEGTRMSDSLADLLQNLHALGDEPELSAGTVAVLVESQRTALYLRFFRGLGLVPRVRVRAVASSEELQRTLDGVQGMDGPKRVIVSRALYWRCYPLLGARRPGEWLVVV